MKEKQIALALLVNNNPGVLSRISGLFARRGYNIDTITAGATSDPNYTRITVAVTGDDDILEQIRKQIAKLEDVVKIVELYDKESVCRELTLVKVRANKKEKQEIIAIADIFRAKIVDVGPESLMIELTGNLNKVDAFLNLLVDFEIIEMVRTGLTGLTRGSIGIKELINN
jgi:acetolactate synthase-1/3 small subunit